MACQKFHEDWTPVEPLKHFITGYDNKVDVWGVGATALEFLTENPPFSHLGAYQAMNKIAKCEMKNELTFEEGISEPLQELILVCLERNPGDRPTIYEILQYPMFSYTTVYHRRGALTDITSVESFLLIIA